MRQRPTRTGTPSWRHPGEVLEAGLLVERRLRAGATEQLRADRDVVVAEALDGGHGLARQHRVDAADLVADFPADLEQLERGSGMVTSRASLAQALVTRCVRR
jgi:hypothetical protein